jgi:hypothetical protein
MEIIDDNARMHIPLGDIRKVSNEQQDKAQLHIASRWGGSPEEKHHDLRKDAQLRLKIPRRSELERKKRHKGRRQYCLWN